MIKKVIIGSIIISVFMASLLCIVKSYEGNPNLVQKNFIMDNQKTLKNSYVFLNDVENPVDIQTVMEHISAHDMFDTNISDDIRVLEDNYTENRNRLGDFDIVFIVIDEEGLEKILTIIIRNVDVKPPALLLHDKSKLRIEQNTSIEKYDFGFTAYDSFDGDLSKDIFVEHDINTNKPGKYQLRAFVSDSSGNTTTNDYEVIVYDLEAPMIVGPIEIVKHINYSLSDDFFLRYFFAKDKNGNDLTSEIEVLHNDYEDFSGVGIYTIILSITDTFGETATHNLNIVVKENIEALLIIDNYNFTVPSNVLISNDNFIKMLQKIGDLPDKSFSFVHHYDAYFENHEKPGVYSKRFNLLVENNQNYYRTLQVEVIDFYLETEGDSINGFSCWIKVLIKIFAAMFIIVFLVFFKIKKQK